MELELSVAQVVIGRREGDMRGFAQRICTGYKTLVRGQASSYRDRLRAVLCDEQCRAEYLSGYHVRVGDDDHSIHADEAVSDG